MSIIPLKERCAALIYLIERRNFTHIAGYKTAAGLIGWPEGERGPISVGQACSLIDYACYVEGLPMLATEYVRKPDGKINERAFPWFYRTVRPELLDVAKSYKWSLQELDRVVSRLNSLPSQDAQTLWAEIEIQGIDHFKRGLHRNIRK